MRNSKTRFMPEVTVKVVEVETAGSPYEQELALEAAIRKAKSAEQQKLEAKHIFGENIQ